MHHDIRLPLAALVPSRSRPGHAGRHLIRALFRVGTSSAATPSSRDPANFLINSRATAQPTGPSHDTAQSNKPLYFLLSVFMLVVHPPPEYVHRLDWVKDYRASSINLSPAPQSTHTVAVVAPVAVEYLPAHNTKTWISKQT
jgi:hypothetical protein